MLVRIRETRSFVRRWWEYKTAPSLWKAVWQFLIKTNLQLPCDPVTASCALVPRDREPVQSSVLHNRQKLEPARGLRQAGG